MLRLSGLSPTEVGAATALGWRFESQDMVTLAIEWIGDGWDSPALFELADLPWHDHDVRGLWATVLTELQITRPERLVAHHVLARWCVQKWEQEQVPDLDLMNCLRDLLTHGAYTRGRDGNAWPGERTLRALTRVPCRPGHAAGDPAPRLHADELRLLDAVRTAVDQALQGAAFAADRTAPSADDSRPIDRDETIRRLLAVAPGFAWDDTDLHDGQCLGGSDHAIELTNWMAQEARRRSVSEVVGAMAAEIEFLLSGGGETSRTRVVEFLEELSDAAVRRSLELDSVAAALGPVARRVWSDVAPSMSEFVNTWGIELAWDANAPSSVLLSDDSGRCSLALNPHIDDVDRRAVVIVWSGVHSLRAGAPNEESVSGHRLHGRGLENIHWGGVVRGSQLIAELEKQNRAHPHHDSARFDQLTHTIVRTKERIFEVVARAMTVDRRPGPCSVAAADALQT